MIEQPPIVDLLWTNNSLNNIQSSGCVTQNPRPYYGSWGSVVLFVIVWTRRIVGCGMWDVSKIVVPRPDPIDVCIP